MIYVLDLGIGTSLKWLYDNQRAGYLYRSNFAVYSTKSNYLVVGSSRANHHYDSKIFEQELNDSFYNCGRDGQNIIYSCAMASAVIHRYKPKLIIIDVHPKEFTNKDEDVLSSLLPYHDDPVIRPYLKYYGRFENVKLVSHIYPYNSLLTSLIAGISPKKNRAEDYHGYIRLDGAVRNKNMEEFKESGEIDTLKINAFRDLLVQLNRYQIPALVVISPLFENYQSTISANACANLCSQFGSVKFLNFAAIPAFKNAEYFKDQAHLNESGAKLFSEEIVKCIRSWEQQNQARRP